MILWLPYKDFSFHDALNCVAASQGSYRHAMGAIGSGYKGHHVVIDWCRNSYWRASYIYAGIKVIDRGSFESVLSSARSFHGSSGRHGACVEINASGTNLTDLEITLAKNLGFIEVESREGMDNRYREISSRDWRNEYISIALNTEKTMGFPATAWLSNSKNHEEYLSNFPKRAWGM